LKEKDPKELRQSGKAQGMPGNTKGSHKNVKTKIFSKTKRK
jgi:hypothetical protein